MPKRRGVKVNGKVIQQNFASLMHCTTRSKKIRAIVFSQTRD